MAQLPSSQDTGGQPHLGRRGHLSGSDDDDYRDDDEEIINSDDDNDDKDIVTCCSMLQAARRRVIASLQSIIMYEYLPAFLGQEVDPYDGYKPDTHPGISHVFQSAAFR